MVSPSRIPRRSYLLLRSLSETISSEEIKAIKAFLRETTKQELGERDSPELNSLRIPLASSLRTRPRRSDMALAAVSSPSTDRAKAPIGCPDTRLSDCQ